MKSASGVSYLIFIMILGAGLALAYAQFGAPKNPSGLAIVVGSFIVTSIAASATKIASQWERTIVLRLGKFRAMKGPGLFFIIPVFETIAYWIDTRVITTTFKAEKT